MNIHAITTITRREVRETLSDWRIVLPIVLLTLLLPQMLVIASRQVIDFVDDISLAGRLVPFAALLVGFVPASFSLITALESFVGERERNSLEALLALPISDRDLYVGKLISALATPLISSLIAMNAFTFLLYTFNPDLYFAAMTFSRLLQLFLLVITMGITMVAAAVVISSHISSIRAANLMSSFVLLPMALVIQWAALLIINERWSVLWITTAVMAVVAAVLVRAGMATFNREDILAREGRQGELLALRDNTALPRPPRSLFPLGTIETITRRELRETLSDWRVLIPVFLLTCVVPIALVSGTNYAINFIGDPLLIGRLVPFAALLIGFVPASFSLITALESFVGERERNSLESLLAMPISDRNLYIGKLISALVVPLLSAFTAIAVFLLMAATFYPELYAVAMNTNQVGLLMLLTMAITIMMVAGAVVISSHTSSIRAATLLASFVLIPTAIFIQLQALLIIARRWDVIWIELAALVVIVIALIRTGMATFNREEILSREHEQLSLQRVLAEFRLFLNEYNPAGTPPAAYAGLSFSPARFYRHELLPLLRELRLPLLTAQAAAIGGVVIGILLARGLIIGNILIRGSSIPGFSDLLSAIGTGPEPSFGLSLLIFANNLRVSILSNVFSSISFGIFAFLVPAVAFAQVALITTQLTIDGGSWLSLAPDSPLTFLLAYVLPHGIVELPTFILSAALGIRIGAALLSPPKGFTVGQNLLWALATFVKVWLLVLLPLVLISALIEGMLTTRVIMLLYS